MMQAQTPTPTLPQRRRRERERNVEDKKMPLKTRLTTKGLEEYLDRLARESADIDAAADAALKAGGTVLVAGERERVAKDTHNLEEHITMSEPEADAGFHFIWVGLVGADANTARYGNVQEFGSRHTQAHPYQRPTMDSDMGRARGEMRRVLRERGKL
jgi:HK97 gp10 family phage protein